MILLILFAFLAGIVTILSPCILPILPIVLSGSLGEGKKRPLGIIFGFVASFTFFTLFLSAIVAASNISADALRNVSVGILFLFGISLLLPKFQLILEQLFSKFSKYGPQSQQKTGFFGGAVIGFSLGLIWTPCVGPILASVITLAATNAITLSALFITLSYALGTAIPMFFIMVTGRKLFEKVPGLVSKTLIIQKFFGVVMILLAIGLYFNVHRNFQAFVLEKFPNYGLMLTQFEENKSVKKSLEDLMR